MSMALLPRLAVALLIPLLTATVAAAPAQAAPTPLHVATVLATEPLPLFLATEKQAPAPFDWTTDGCSTPDILNLKATVDVFFYPACVRHDFGYRNFGGSGLRLDPTEKRRAAVDLQFYADMLLLCGGLSGADRTLCDGLAFAFYLAVRIFGGPDFGSTRPSTVTPQQRQQVAPYLSKISG